MIIDTPIGRALAEAGRLIEEAEPHTRKAQVRTHIEAMGDAERVNFLTGVCIVAHDSNIRDRQAVWVSRLPIAKGACEFCTGPSVLPVRFLVGPDSRQACADHLGRACLEATSGN